MSRGRKGGMELGFGWGWGRGKREPCVPGSKRNVGFVFSGGGGDHKVPLTLGEPYEVQIKRRGKTLLPRFITMSLGRNSGGSRPSSPLAVKKNNGVRRIIVFASWKAIRAGGGEHEGFQSSFRARGKSIRLVVHWRLQAAIC